MMTLQLIGAFIILIGVNIVTFEFGKQFDLTRERGFTLSELTQKNLTAPLIQDRNAPVKIIAVIDKRQFAQLQQDSQEDITMRIQGKLQEYVDKSSKRIEVEYVDPIVDHGRTLELSKQYQHNFTQSMLIIDAFDKDVITDAYLEKVLAANPTLEKKQAKGLVTEELRARHVRFLPVTELFYSDFNRYYDDQAFVAAWKDEAEITTNLMRALEGKQKKVYFLYDKCRLDSKKGGLAPWEYIRNVYRSQNIQLEQLSLAQIDKIPDDADGIALISPTVDFTDQELLALSEYWETRLRASVFITLDPEVHLPKLYSFLFRSAKVKPQQNRIVNIENGQVLVNAEVEFLQGPQVNGDLSSKSTTFDGSSQGIHIETNTINDNIEAFPLIKTSPGWWGETQFGEGTIAYDEKYDHSSPLYLGAAVTRGKLNNQLTAPLVSKMVMLGNTDFLSPDHIREEQREYVAQIGNWLVGREPLMNIQQHHNRSRKVFIARGHSNFLSTLFTFGIPAAALIFTGFIWNIRRS